MYNVAIIGAGMSGLTCANYLFSKGFKVTVFEKSHGLGGRMATRRINDDLAVDHGVQYVNSDTPIFSKYLDECISNGLAAFWSPSGMDLKCLNKNKIIVGIPGMNNLLKLNTNKLNIKFSFKAESIKIINKKWLINFENLELNEQFDLVVFTIPPTQVKDIISKEKGLVDELSTVEVDPCWSLILITKNKLNCKDYNRFDGNEIASIVYNNSKPKRNNKVNTYIIHSGSEWAKQNLSLKPEEAELKLSKLLADKLNQKLNIKYIKAHKWLYAKTRVPLGKPFINNQDYSLFIGGDWCLGANVESAFKSGLKIAEFIDSKFRN